MRKVLFRTPSQCQSSQNREAKQLGLRSFREETEGRTERFHPIVVGENSGQGPGDGLASAAGNNREGASRLGDRNMS